MNTRHTSKLNKACKNLQKSSSPKEDVIQRKCRSKRRRMGLSKPEAGNTTTNTDERSVSDIINLMERKQVKVVDKGLDESDEDYGSINSSIASGPSLHYVRDLEKLRTSQDLCSSCLKLYRKAKKMRAPIKDTLLDNNPTSLTCDQWILLKKWKPVRFPTARRKLMIHVQLIKTRLQVKNIAKQNRHCLGGTDLSACSRSHVFLQRNLRRRVKVPMKTDKNNRRKRARDNSQGSRTAKQKRLQDNNHRQHISVNCTDVSGFYTASGQSTNPGFEGCSDGESKEDTHVMIEFSPSTVTLETTKPRDVPPKPRDVPPKPRDVPPKPRDVPPKPRDVPPKPRDVPPKPRDVPSKQKAQKKASGFRGLLAQLRGNSSMIVRETH